MGFAEELDLESTIKHPHDAKVFGLIIWRMELLLPEMGRQAQEQVGREG